METTDAPVSPRLVLARAAATAALDSDGVVALDPAARYSTRSGQETVPGVLVVADEPGRYSVTIHVHARPVDGLADIGTAIAAAVAAALPADMRSALGPVDVIVTDLDLSDGTP